MTEELFERRRTLGAGGMGEVFLALHKKTGAEVVVKVLRDDVPQQALARFEREFAVLSDLKHPAIVPVLEWGRMPTGEPFYTMPFIGDAINLEAWASKALATGAPPPQADVVRVLTPVAAALDYLHSKGLRHRDVKPSNVMVRPSGEGLLIDFGLVGLVQSELTRTGMVLGTMQYLSPEQARGEDAGPASDVYQLGLVVYELACGQRACGDAYKWVDEFKHGRRPFPPPSAREPKVGAGLEEVVLRATDHDPAKRFPTAAALVEALAAVPPEKWRGARATRKTRPVAAMPAPAPVRPAAPSTGTGRAAAASLGVVLVTCALAAAWFKTRACAPTAPPRVVLGFAAAEVQVAFACPAPLRVVWHPEASSTERVATSPDAESHRARLEPLEAGAAYQYAISSGGRVLDRGRFTAPPPLAITALEARSEKSGTGLDLTLTAACGGEVELRTAGASQTLKLGEVSVAQKLSFGDVPPGGPLTVTVRAVSALGEKATLPAQVVRAKGGAR